MRLNSFDEVFESIWTLEQKDYDLNMRLSVYDNDKIAMACKIIKMQEELGELAAGFLKRIGYKKTDESTIDIENNIKEEMVDLFIMVVATMQNQGMTHEEILNLIPNKLKKWNIKHLTDASKQY